MDFFINKNSTLPVLYLELIPDGRYDYSCFYDKLQNSNIYFMMSDIDTGVKKVGKKLTPAVKKEECVGDDGCLREVYYLSYKFSERDTNKAGVFIGQFIIDFLDGSGELIVPIREELRINILEGSIKK
jgi:hypothetical protein